MNTAARATPAIKTKRKKVLDQAEIERMALVEAECREAQRREMIATAAYFLAEKRGFEPGYELEDWFAAELEVAHAQQLSTLSPGTDLS